MRAALEKSLPEYYVNERDGALYVAIPDTETGRDEQELSRLNRKISHIGRLEWAEARGFALSDTPAKLEEAAR